MPIYSSFIMYIIKKITIGNNGTLGTYESSETVDYTEILEESQTLLEKVTRNFVKKMYGVEALRSICIATIHGLEQVCEPPVDGILLYRLEDNLNKILVFQRKTTVVHHEATLLWKAYSLPITFFGKIAEFEVEECNLRFLQTHKIELEEAFKISEEQLQALKEQHARDIAYYVSRCQRLEQDYLTLEAEFAAKMRSAIPIPPPMPSTKVGTLELNDSPPSPRLHVQKSDNNTQLNTNLLSDLQQNKRFNNFKELLSSRVLTRTVHIVQESDLEDSVADVADVADSTNEELENTVGDVEEEEKAKEEVVHNTSEKEIFINEIVCENNCPKLEHITNEEEIFIDKVSEPCPGIEAVVAEAVVAVEAVEAVKEVEAVTPIQQSTSSEETDEQMPGLEPAPINTCSYESDDSGDSEDSESEELSSLAIAPKQLSTSSEDSEDSDDNEDSEENESEELPGLEDDCHGGAGEVEEESENNNNPELRFGFVVPKREIDTDSDSSDSDSDSNSDSDTNSDPNYSDSDPNSDSDTLTFSGDSDSDSDSDSDRDSEYY